MSTLYTKFHINAWNVYIQNECRRWRKAKCRVTWKDGEGKCSPFQRASRQIGRRFAPGLLLGLPLPLPAAASLHWCTKLFLLKQGEGGGIHHMLALPCHPTSAHSRVERPLPSLPAKCFSSSERGWRATLTSSPYLMAVLPPLDCTLTLLPWMDTGIFTA